MEKLVVEQEAKIKDYLLNLPNLLEDSVPVGKDSSENVTVKKWGNHPTIQLHTQKPHRPRHTLGPNRYGTRRQNRRRPILLPQKRRSHARHGTNALRT